MFSFSYNYIYFFFNYELLVLVCFLLFIFFALISENGHLGSYLQEISIDARNKIFKHLVIRQELIQDLVSSLDKSTSKIKMIMTTLLSSSEDIVVILQYTCKNLSKSNVTLKVRYYLDNLVLKSQHLSQQIRLYLTQELFSQKSFYLQVNNVKLKKVKI
jgi:hypothetical protein